MISSITVKVITVQVTLPNRRIIKVRLTANDTVDALFQQIHVNSLDDNAILDYK